MDRVVLGKGIKANLGIPEYFFVKCCESFHDLTVTGTVTDKAFLAVPRFFKHTISPK
jgi:hypothetical protein